MVRATVLLQPGWVHERITGAEVEDPVTGVSIPSAPTITTGLGLIQQPLWTGFSEVTEHSVTDERIVMFAPADTHGFEITADDTFIDPAGRCWQATTDGLPRGIPGQSPEYFACTVRRAKEHDHA